MPSFNLLEERWLPCAERAGGAPQLLSLRDVFIHAPRLASLTDPSPAVTISLHRLLLAILHRAFNGPRDFGEWRQVWQRGEWEASQLMAYLDRWRDRFDLFDDRHPFYQTPGLIFDPADVPGASQLAQEKASGRNSALLFDHTPDGASFTPAEAARYVVAMHNFAVGGLFNTLPGETFAERSTKAAHLLGTAVTLARGETLFRTLMLNWIPYNRDDDAPFPFGGDDRPAWERDGARPEPRLPDGYVDLLTWQSRRIALVPEVAPDKSARVQCATLMKGFQFGEGFEVWNAETMVAYRKNKNARNGPTWFAVGLNPDRVVWRDSQALIQSIADQHKRPRMMDWLDTLVDKGILDERLIIPLDVYGLIPDQANIQDWRRESLPLPRRMLEQRQQVAQQLLQRLTQAIALAEGVGQLLDVTLLSGGSGARNTQEKSPMWALCETLLADLSDRQPRREDCANLARSFGAGPRYWSRLDAPFRAFIQRLADPADEAVEDGATLYGIQALRAWVDDVTHAGTVTFDAIVANLDMSARALHASTLGQGRFRYHLKALTNPHQATAHDVDERTEEGGVA